MAQMNTTGPTTYTTGFLVTDTNNNGTITNTLTPGTAFDFQSTLGSLCVPRMTSTEIAAITSIPDGSLIYDITTNSMNIYAGGSPGPVNTIPAFTDRDTTIYMGFEVGNDTALNTTNIFFGVNSGTFANTNSEGNTIFGGYNLESLTGGRFNVAVGVGCIPLITTQDRNIAIGFETLVNSTLTSQTIGIGYIAGATYTNLTNCIFIGDSADALNDNLTNAVSIGAGALVATSNSMVLGNGCNVGIGTSSPTSALHAVSAASAISCQGSFIGKVHTNAGTPYTIAANDFLVAQTATASAISLVLPAISAANTGVMYRIKDQSGAANTHNITISTTGGKTIDGAATNVINTAYGHVTIYNDGTQWYTI